MTLYLNCANFKDERKKEPTIPPNGLEQYPCKVNREYIKKIIEKEKIEVRKITAYNGRLNENKGYKEAPAGRG